jgi:hypothetical protein
VVHQPQSGLAFGDRHLQGLYDDLLSQTGCHRPADHPPAAAIEDEGQVDEALRGTTVGYVRDPQPIRFSREEVPFEQVSSAVR